MAAAVSFLFTSFFGVLLFGRLFGTEIWREWRIQTMNIETPGRGVEHGRRAEPVL